MGIRDWLRRRRIGRNVRKQMVWWNLYMARFSCPRLVGVPPGRQILTLSPHPDDDVIGVGGTLVKHHQAGCRLTTLVLTDGGAGDPEYKRSEVVQMRQQEQQAAAAHLGINRIIFWDEPDGALAPNDANAKRLRSVLSDVQPDLVYVPSFLDVHPDHRVVTSLLARALQDTDLSFTCGIYETNTPIVPNVLVDISGEMDTKLQAVGEHRSQQEYVDYLDIVRAKGRWRSDAFSRSVQYVEAFYVDNVHDYLALWQQASRV